jgi:hypothetical protein
MRHRKHRSRPPTSPNYKSGLVLTFAPSDNEPDPSKMVEVITVASAPLVLEVAPDDKQTKLAETTAAQALVTQLAGYVFEWVRNNGQEKWDQLSDEAKRVVVEDFAERLTRSGGAKDAIHEIVKTFQAKS